MTVQPQEATPHGALAIRSDQTQLDELQYAAMTQLWGDDKPTNADVSVLLHYAQRTGLDPFARQLYMIKRQGKWGIQLGIDALRIVAQRSHEYEGQTPTQWCGIDGQWVDVWLNVDTPPHAARVGVWRRGFREPLYAVARMVSYRPPPPSDKMWTKMPDHMLGKVAEALALRKAFPNDLSGLYIAEERDSDHADATAAPAPEPAAALDTADEATVDRLRTLVLRAHAETDGNQRRDLLAALWHDAITAEALNCQVAVPLGWYDGEADMCTLGALIVQAGRLDTPHGEDLPDEPVDADVVGDPAGGGCGQIDKGRYCLLGPDHDGRHQYPKAEG